MKKLFLMLLCIPLIASCYGYSDEEIQYAKVYFPLATHGTNGVFDAQFSAASDTVFKVAAYCSGSIMTPVDVDVQVALAADSLATARAAKPALAAYELLPESYYEITPADLKVTIKKDTDKAYLKVTFHTSMFQAGKKYILPLKIASVSKYEIAEKNECLFFGVTLK